MAEVKIESKDGLTWKTKIEVDGVSLPCTKATWTADAGSGMTTCLLELPRVNLDADVREVVARYVTPNSGVPMHWWNCPCGASEAHIRPELAVAAFRDPERHVRGCPHVAEEVASEE